MFSVNDFTFAFLLYLYNDDKMLNKYPRTSLNRHAIRFGIPVPGGVRSKKQLLEFILFEWGAQFRKDPEYKKAYQERWGFQFSMDRIE